MNLVANYLLPILRYTSLPWYILNGNLSLRSIPSEVTISPYIILISDDNVFTMMKINGKSLLVSFPRFIPSTRYLSIKHMCAGTNLLGTFFISNVWWAMLGLWWDTVFSRPEAPRDLDWCTGIFTQLLHYKVAIAKPV